MWARVREKGMEWPIGIVLFFVVVGIANVTLVYYANSSWNGLYTTGHYQKGLEYNQVLQAQARQERLGWQGALQVAGLRAGSPGTVRFLLNGPDDAPVAGAQVVATLFRPVVEGYDQRLALTEAAPGRYEAQLSLPLPGAWDVKVQVDRGEDDFRFAQRIQVDEKQEGS